MESGDGLIVRLRTTRGVASTAQIRLLAGAAHRFGNGIIELTRRGNLQLRGITPGTLPDLQAELCRAGLAEASREAERPASLLVCPLSGLDPRCPPLERVADGLEEVLSSLIAPRLSDKFVVCLSGGSDLLERVSADVRITLRHEHPGLAELAVAGDRRERELRLGQCRVGSLPLVLHALLQQVLEQTPGQRLRVRDAVRARGESSLRAALAPLLEMPARGGRAEEMAGTGTPPWRARCVGFNSGVSSWLGLVLPFGSGLSDDWSAIAELAERFGSGEVRLTPARAVLIVGVGAADRERGAAFAEARGFGVRQQPPRLELIACSGAPACRSAQGETRRLASSLGAIVGAGIRSGSTLHVSGCEKGCAWGGPADITLVHAADGYRLGFGTDVAQTSETAPLSLDSVRARVARSFGAPPP
jgi:precorrin-3B synthase